MRFATATCLILSLAVVLTYAQHPSRSQQGSAGVAIWDGTIYITDIYKNLVMTREPGSTTFQPFVSDPRIVTPRGLAVDQTSLYVADPNAHQVFRVDRLTKEVSPLLPDNSAATPIDLVLVPALVRTNDKFTRVASLAILDESTRSVFTLTASPSNSPITSLGNHRFTDPQSMSILDTRLFVSDYGAGAILSSNARSTSGASPEWIDIRSLSTYSITLFNFSLQASGFFFPSISHPQSAVPFRDVIYVVDDRKLYVYLPSRGRLIPLSYRPSPSPNPARVVVSEGTDELLLVGSDVEDLRTWPLLLPMTVEVEAGGDVSTPLASLYRYLWRKGYLPSISIPLPYKGPSGDECSKPACLVEKARNLLPRTNLLMEQLLCEMNSDLCSNSKMRKVKAGQSITIPEVPFEPYLSTESRKFDGKTTIQSLLEQMIPDQRLLLSISEGYLRPLNPNQDVRLAATPDKGVSLQVPVQHNRYYLTVAKSELFSPDSELASLLKHYSALSLRPYGTTSRASPQTSTQQDIQVHDTPQINEIEKTMLNNIGFKTDRSVKYGRANEIPILIDEAALDCQHPVFFGSNQEDRAFSSNQCAPAEAAPTPVVVDWSDSASRHGTCVASIIGARSAPYGSGLAAGADLSLLGSVAVDEDLLIRFYKREREPFIVNVSSGDGTNTAENNWRPLLNKQFEAENVLFVAAADNDDDLLSNRKKFPAILAREFPNVISVGALDRNGTNVWRDSANRQGSNIGFKVELLAPGEAVPCAIEVSQGQALYAGASGTSFATPLVSAVAALLLAKRLSPAEVKARLLATADPLDNQRLGEPLALFGRLNIDNALLSPKMSHIVFLQKGKRTDLDGDILEGSTLTYRSPDSLLKTSTPISYEDVLSVRNVGNDADGNVLYRLVWFDEPNRRVDLKDRVLLNGCFRVQGRQNDDVYVVSVGASCPAAGEVKDQTKVINELELLIAPTLGAARFKRAK